jgi:hypothetical protein
MAQLDNLMSCLQEINLMSCLQEINLGDGPDTRLLKLNGKPYSARGAYVALDTSGDSTYHHGRRIWGHGCQTK